MKQQNTIRCAAMMIYCKFSLNVIVLSLLVATFSVVEHQYGCNGQETSNVPLTPPQHLLPQTGPPFVHGSDPYIYSDYDEDSKSGIDIVVIVLVAAILVVLIVALIFIEKKFRTLSSGFNCLSEVLDGISGSLRGILGVLGDIPTKLGSINAGISNVNGNLCNINATLGKVSKPLEEIASRLENICPNCNVYVNVTPCKCSGSGCGYICSSPCHCGASSCSPCRCGGSPCNPCPK